MRGTLSTIYNTLSHLQTYRGLSEQMDAALNYIARTDLAALTAGRHDILGDRAYVNRQSPVYRQKTCGSVMKNISIFRSA